MITFIIAGAIGGLLRGAVGVSKYMRSYKDVTIRPWYFAGMVALSAVVGGAAAWVTNDLGLAFLGLEELPVAVAFIIGYAGGDFIENIAKIIAQKSTLFE